MVTIPADINEPVISLLDRELPKIKQGKVRDLYDLGNGRALVVCSDRVSAHDIVLNGTIPEKGAVLAALNIYWRQLLRQNGFPGDDLVAFGSQIDQYLPAKLCRHDELKKRAVVVEHCEVIPIEAIVRGRLTGSGFEEYETHGTLYDTELPAGMTDGSPLPEPFFTPTDKGEKTGHDQPVSVRDVRQQYPSMEPTVLSIFEFASTHAAERGVIIADSKFEFGILRGEDAMRLIDEVLTPDSSRFWLAEDLEEAMRQGRKPPSRDKDPARRWAKENGIDKSIDPTNPDHVAWAQSIPMPADVTDQIADTYKDIAHRLMGQNLTAFGFNQLGITPAM